MTFLLQFVTSCYMHFGNLEETGILTRPEKRNILGDEQDTEFELSTVEIVSFHSSMSNINCQ